MGLHTDDVVLLLFLFCLRSATNPAEVRFRKPPTNEFETNPEGRLIITGEGEEQGEEQGGSKQPDFEEEEMDVDKVKYLPLLIDVSDKVHTAI